MILSLDSNFTALHFLLCSFEVLLLQNMAIERTEIPTDDALSNALSGLRLEHAALGAAKLHATLLEQQPSWTVSEKRTRKALQAAGLSLPAPTSTDPDGATTKNPNATNTNGTPATALSKKKKKAGAGANARVYPASQLTSKLDVSAFSPKVTVHQFGGGKGKGLVATSDIAQGEVLWKEDPWALAAEWWVSSLLMFMPSHSLSHVYYLNLLMSLFLMVKLNGTE
jgi:hypothetical protein